MQSEGVAPTPAAGMQAKQTIAAAPDNAGLERATFKAPFNAVLPPSEARTELDAYKGSTATAMGTIKLAESKAILTFDKCFKIFFEVSGIFFSFGPPFCKKIKFNIY